MGCKEGHAYCSNCFVHTIRSQVQEGRAEFMKVGCLVCCPFCPATQSLPAFEMRAAMTFLDDAAYDCWQACIVEKAVTVAREECEKRHAKHIKQLQQKTPSGMVSGQMGREVDHISEYLIVPRCPQCARQVPGFDACAAMSCDVDEGGCGGYVCAWCLELQVAVVRTPTVPGRTARLVCHDHVRSCSFNPTNNVYPPSPHPQIWQGVMDELARKRVNDYIKGSVSKELRKIVHDECKKRHPEINLQDFGVAVSDGYRVQQGKRAPRILGFEEKITILMDMNVSTRVRAVHVLEAMENDLDRAIEILLGLR